LNANIGAKRETRVLRASDALEQRAGVRAPDGGVALERTRGTNRR
jgi:hypothetical protein